MGNDFYDNIEKEEDINDFLNNDDEEEDNNKNNDLNNNDLYENNDESELTRYLKLNKNLIMFEICLDNIGDTINLEKLINNFFSKDYYDSVISIYENEPSKIPGISTKIEINDKNEKYIVLTFKDENISKEKIITYKNIVQIKEILLDLLFYYDNDILQKK